MKLTATDVLPESLLDSWAAHALHSVKAAGDRLTAAKRTRSLALIGCAQNEVQAAVDVARQHDVPWGEIGSALGIARGNAYQRYRKKAAANAHGRSCESSARTRLSA